jgi:adenosylcobinamide-GDP ribazoletransferase
MALVIKVALVAQLAALGSVVLVVGLFLAHVVSRTWPLVAIRLLPHVGDLAGSKSKPLADQISANALAVALLWCVAAFALWAYAQPYVPQNLQPAASLWEPLAYAVACSALAFVWMWRWFKQRLQGFTGDCLGAIQQVCELAFYLGLAIGWSAIE